MKKLIGLIVIVVVIMVLLKLMGGRVSPSSDSKENIESDEWKVVNTVLAQGNTQKEVIGANLPKSARGTRYYIHLDISTKTKSTWMVTELPKDDFDEFKNQLEFANEPDLLTIWPDAFDCDQEELKKYWKITKYVDENTYYGEDPKIESRIMLKYEEGKVYIKRSTYYDGKIGSDHQMYLKVRRR
ncbi:MAG: hypothetical protein ACYS0I_06495 [Planctomycetota bacterium]